MQMDLLLFPILVLCVEPIVGSLKAVLDNNKLSQLVEVGVEVLRELSKDDDDDVILTTFCRDKSSIRVWTWTNSCRAFWHICPSSDSSLIFPRSKY